MATLKASSDLQALIKKIVLDTYFPVGSIYLSVNKTNPGSTFGGTWELVSNDSYLHCYNPNNAWFANIGVNNKGTGNQVGSFSTNNTSLSVAQLPAHSHSAWLNNSGEHEHIMWFGGGANSGNGGQIPVANQRWGQDVAGQTKGGHDHGGISVANTGSGQGHNHFHILPFYIVAVWRRTK